MLEWKIEARSPTFTKFRSCRRSTVKRCVTRCDSGSMASSVPSCPGVTGLVFALSRAFALICIATGSAALATADVASEELPDPMEFGLVYQKTADTKGDDLISEGEFARDAAAAFSGLDGDHAAQYSEHGCLTQLTGADMESDTYSTVPGWATITALREPDALAYNLGDAVEIVFNFEPDDPAARDAYTMPAVGDRGHLLTVGAGANPPRSWATRMGFTPGSRHRCLRRELLQGVSTPVVFEFPDIDDAALAAAYQEGGP